MGKADFEPSPEMKELNQLIFVHNLDGIKVSGFCAAHSVKEAIELIKICVAENDKRKERDLQPLKIRSLFGQRACQYGNQQHSQYQRDEWQRHVEAVKESDYKPTYEQLLAEVDASPDSDEKKTAAKNFLRRLYGDTGLEDDNGADKETG